MIYRIKVSSEFERAGLFHNLMAYHLSDNSEVLDYIEDYMTEVGIKPISPNNQRGKFWFTKEGWDICGREITKKLKQNKIPFKVLRAKNPKKSDVVYKDHYQMAILPIKGKTRS